MIETKFEGGWWYYRVGDGGWCGQFSCEENAIAAAQVWMRG